MCQGTRAKKTLLVPKCGTCLPSCWKGLPIGVGYSSIVPQGASDIPTNLPSFPKAFPYSIFCGVHGTFTPSVPAESSQWFLYVLSSLLRQSSLFRVYFRSRLKSVSKPTMLRQVQGRTGNHNTSLREGSSKREARSVNFNNPPHDQLIIWLVFIINQRTEINILKIDLKLTLRYLN